MGKLTIKQVSSKIKRPENQKRTLLALGIKKMNHSAVVDDTPQIRGMIRKVSHLVSVTEK